MIQQFIDREEEVKFLNKLYRTKGSQFLVLYGRRRIGKTELVTHFSNKYPHIYLLADRRGDVENINEFKRAASLFLNNKSFLRLELNNYIEFFEELVKFIKKRVIIIIDEFPYLIEGSKATTSVFQKIWDMNLKNKNIFLILTGSSIGMMEQEVLSYKSPLYGRRTAQWKLEPIPFRYISEFFPNYTMEDLIGVFSVLDGIPMYLLKFNPRLSLIKNISHFIMKKGTFLFQEAEILIKDELREPRFYFSILKAIANGNRKFSDILNSTQLDKTLVSKYLDILIDLHIIIKEHPITINKPKSRETLYYISDNYFKFWFSFVYPYKSEIEQGKGDSILKNNRQRFNQYISFNFENICKIFVRDNLNYNKVGKWWHKDKEIDIVALNEEKKEILFGECKWKDKVNAERVLRNLKEKTDYVDWNNGKRKEHYIIFAKSFKKKIKEENLFLFDLKDLEKIFRITKSYKEI